MEEKNNRNHFRFPHRLIRDHIEETKDQPVFIRESTAKSLDLENDKEGCLEVTSFNDDDDDDDDNGNNNSSSKTTRE